MRGSQSQVRSLGEQEGADTRTIRRAKRKRKEEERKKKKKGVQRGGKTGFQFSFLDKMRVLAAFILFSKGNRGGSTPQEEAL